MNWWKKNPDFQKKEAFKSKLYIENQLIAHQDRNFSLTMTPVIRRKLWRAFHTSAFVDKVFSGCSSDRLRCGRTVLAEWSNSDRDRRRGVREEKKEPKTRQRAERGERRGETGEGGGRNWEKLPLTAMGPLNNPGILSEINLSSWSCWACRYGVLLALSQRQFVQCSPVRRGGGHGPRSVCLLNYCPRRVVQIFNLDVQQRRSPLMDRTERLLEPSVPITGKY